MRQLETGLITFFEDKSDRYTYVREELGRGKIEGRELTQLKVCNLLYSAIVIMRLCLSNFFVLSMHTLLKVKQAELYEPVQEIREATMYEPVQKVGKPIPYHVPLEEIVSKSFSGTPYSLICQLHNM